MCEFETHCVLIYIVRHCTLINFGNVKAIVNFSLGTCLSKHIARVIVAVMAEALGERFSLEELEINELENAAALVNVGKLKICSCLR